VLVAQALIAASSWLATSSATTLSSIVSISVVLGNICAATEEMRTAAAPGASRGSAASSRLSVAPMLTFTMVCQLPRDGETPAACTKASSGPY
jgi:hypothetical protein